MSTLAIAPDERIKVRVDAVCHTCKVRHKIDTDVSGFHRASWDWYAKHDPRTHKIEFLSTERRLPKGLDDRVYSRADVEPWFLTYRENADIKIAYAAAATFTLGLHATPLASSSTFAAGRESTAINNTSNKYIDYKVAGKVTTGTSPTTAKSIRIYAYSAVDDTPTYPDTIDGTDSDETLTSAEELAALGWLGSTSTTATSNQVYWFTALRTIATVFGFCPTYFGLYVSHDTAVALNSTAGNHSFTHIGSYFTQV